MRCTLVLFLFLIIKICTSHLLPNKSVLKKAAYIAVSSSLLLNTQMPLATQPVLAASTSITTQQLVDKIEQLEKATSRQDVVQGMADLFEAAGSKTLLARTKYKYRIINTINDKHVLLGKQNEWDQALNYESGELKRRVDPFRTVDLNGYLKIAPYVGGVIYVVLLGVQQFIPEIFAFAYPFGVAVFCLPIIFILLTT